MDTAQDYLRAIRAKNLTQEEIARRCGIAQASISKIERGEVQNVMATTYLSIKGLFDELYPRKPDAANESGKARA